MLIKPLFSYDKIYLYSKNLEQYLPVLLALFFYFFFYLFAYLFCDWFCHPFINVRTYTHPKFIPTYFQNSEPPIICYKYNTPIRNTVFNFNKLVSDLDIHATTPETWDCKDSKFVYPAAGHIMTGNLKIISNSRIRYIVFKGPKYRSPTRIDFKKCREEIASALNDFVNWWCKREYVEPNALKEWKVSIFKIVDQRIKFNSQKTNLLPPKPKSTFRYLKQGIQDFHWKYVLVSADKTANNFVVAWRLHYINNLKPGGTITVPYHLMLLDRLTWWNDYWTASPYVSGQFHLALLNRITWRYWTASPGSSERYWTVSESSISYGYF